MKLTPLWLLLTACTPLAANEALDLLEGRDESSSWSNTLPSPSSGPEASPDGSRDEAAEYQNWDYRDRWQYQLPPLYSPYRNPDNPVVQEVSVNGLFEWRLEDGSFERDSGAETGIDGSSNRRARLGASVRAFYNTEVEARAVFDGSDYRGIDTLRATVDVTDSVLVAAGKFRAPFSSEYSTDPALRLTPEMAPLTRQVVPANTLGAMVALQAGPWDYGLGYFTGDIDKNLPGLNGDGFLLAKLAYTFQGTTAGDEDEGPGAPGNSYQRWHFDYIYNLDAAASMSIPMAYEHLVSTGIEVSSEKFDLLVDLMLANGDLTTAWGLTVLGSYWLYEDAVQLVARYHYADTDDDDGIVVGYGIPGAFSDSIHPQAFPVTFTTDELHSYYAGMNFHLFENYLLLNTGIEYQLLKDNGDATMDADSWIWQAGGKIAF